jgi:hypothetical protein
MMLGSGSVVAPAGGVEDDHQEHSMARGSGILRHIAAPKNSDRDL